MNIFFTCKILHGMDRLPLPLCRQQAHLQGLYLCIYNIYDGRGFGLTQAIQVIHFGSFGGMLLTNTKITSEAY